MLCCVGIPRLNILKGGPFVVSFLFKCPSESMLVRLRRAIRLADMRSDRCAEGRWSLCVVVRWRVFCARWTRVPSKVLGTGHGSVSSSITVQMPHSPNCIPVRGRQVPKVSGDEVGQGSYLSRPGRHGTLSVMTCRYLLTQP